MLYFQWIQGEWVGGENFKNLSYGDMSKYLSKDHIAGVKNLIDLGFVNPSRIGAWGWSGGGYFTCNANTEQ